MTEKKLHKQIIDYIDLQYKGVVVQSDPNGLKTTIGQAFDIKARRLPKDGGHPDIFVYCTRGNFSGLFLEVKTEKNNPYKKNGELKKGDHIHKQAALHERLRAEGYIGGFAVGFDRAKAMIDEYMRLG